MNGRKWRQGLFDGVNDLVEMGFGKGGGTEWEAKEGEACGLEMEGAERILASECVQMRRKLGGGEVCPLWNGEMTVSRLKGEVKSLEGDTQLIVDLEDLGEGAH